jgi:hypothetical protein
VTLTDAVVNTGVYFQYTTTKQNIKKCIPDVVPKKLHRTDEAAHVAWMGQYMAKGLGQRTRYDVHGFG